MAELPRARLVDPAGDHDVGSGIPKSDKELRNQFAGLQGIFPSAGKIPEDKKKLIRWAEGELSKRGLK